MGGRGGADGQLYRPSGVAVDTWGNVYVADVGNNRIQKFTSEEAFLQKWGTQGGGDGEFRYPMGVALDSSGNMFVVDTNNHRIQKFTSEGVFLTKWGSEGTRDGELWAPCDAAVDSSGNVYVSDYNNQRIQKFRREFGMKGVYADPLGQPFIEWYSASGRSYTVWLSADLLDWSAFPETLPASGTGINSWTDDGQHSLGPPSGAKRRFYRVELLP